MRRASISNASRSRFNRYSNERRWRAVNTGPDTNDIKHHAWRGVPGFLSSRRYRSHGQRNTYSPPATRDRLVLTKGEQVQPAPPERVEEMVRRAEALGLHDHSGYWSSATDALFEGVTLFQEEMSR